MTDDHPAITRIIEEFISDLPFNQLVGLQVCEDDEGNIAVGFENRDALSGNPLLKTLHGGMIATAMDVAGALPVLAVAAKRQLVKDTDPNQLNLKRLGRACTIDLKIDYLRPGKGKYFTCKGKLRHGATQLLFTDMELTNEKGTLIARATGAYMLGR
jgi:uncharacterized protein (TIGR00369 family)